MGVAMHKKLSTPAGLRLRSVQECFRSTRSHDSHERLPIGRSLVSCDDDTVLTIRRHVRANEWLFV